MTDLTKQYITDIQAALVDESSYTIEQATELLEESGIPTKKHEDWKYTSLSKSLLPNFKPATSATINAGDINDLVYDNNNVLVLSAGELNENFTKLAKGVEINFVDGDIFKGLENKRDLFTDMNTTFAKQVIELTIPKNTKLETPLTLIHFNDNQTAFSRVSIKAENGSKADIIEIFAGNNEYQVNAVTELAVEPNANLSHIKVQLDSDNAFHMGTTLGKLEEHSTLHSFTMNLKGKAARHNFLINIDGKEATANVHGLFAQNHTRHCDNFALINHNVEHTYSDQLFKGILTDESTGAFTGKIVVQRDAQKVESAQLNKNLLLSKKAHVDTRPQLEVYADDVKCAHGATVGQLSDEELFYLQTRGIKAKDAYQILSKAFAADALDKVENQTIKAYLSDLLYKHYDVLKQ